jgi:hypothetical protein
VRCAGRCFWAALDLGFSVVPGHCVFRGSLGDLERELRGICVRYYLYAPLSVSTKPLFLVPAEEVLGLLAEINHSLSLSLQFPTIPGFRLDFACEDVPRPSFLGISSSKTVFGILEKQVPGREFRIDGERAMAAGPADRSYEAFKNMMESAFAAAKKKAKVAREKKRIQNKDG